VKEALRQIGRPRAAQHQPPARLTRQFHIASTRARWWARISGPIVVPAASPCPMRTFAAKAASRSR
jgi:hypothetical protein